MSLLAHTYTDSARQANLKKQERIYKHNSRKSIYIVEIIRYAVNSLAKYFDNLKKKLRNNKSPIFFVFYKHSQKA